MTALWPHLLAVLMVGLAWQSESLGASPESLPGYSNAVSMREDATLRAVAFGNSKIGVACGDRGTILRTVDGGQSWTMHKLDLDCSLSDVVWLGARKVIIVGGAYDRVTRISRGVALFSNDAGQTWQRSPDKELPRLRLAQSENGQVVAWGDWSHSLLTRRLESHDGGRTWNSDSESSAGGSAPTTAQLYDWSRVTGVPITIRDACQVDSLGLCAVGDHGVILLSADRGESWRPVRGHQRRTAILFVARDPKSAPWSIVGNEALENRNRVSLLFHQVSGASPAEQALETDVARQVATMLGAAGCDLIGADQGDHTTAASQWIAIHGPDVVVLDDGLPESIRAAFLQAATSVGVRRVALASNSSEGATTLHQHALLRRAGVVASDLAADAMHYLSPQHQPSSSTSLRFVYDAVPGSRRGVSVLDGIPRSAGTKLSAAAPQSSRRKIQIVQARLRQSERMREILRGSRSGEQFAKSLGAILDQTAREDQFRLAWSTMLNVMSGKEVAINGWAEKRVVFLEAVLDQISTRFAGSSVSKWAQLRIEAIHHSDEWRRLRGTFGDSTFGKKLADVSSVPVSPFQAMQGGNIQQASATSPIVVPLPEVHDLSRRDQRESDEVDLVWEFHPFVLLSREAARRRGDTGGLQVTGEVSPNLQRLMKASGNAWTHLTRDRGRQVVFARRSDSPPKLDGIIDEDCWATALPSAGHAPSLRIAYDDEYVYLAVRCKRGDQESVAAPMHATTSRDHDLTSVDRLQIRIDTDRDCITSMQLEVSDDGRTHDSIDGVEGWQPSWYVDTQQSSDAVFFEIAVLRRDLVDLPIAEGESWFVATKRLGRGQVSTGTIIPRPGDWSRVIFRP